MDLNLISRELDSKDFHLLQLANARYTLRSRPSHECPGISSNLLRFPCPWYLPGRHIKRVHAL